MNRPTLTKIWRIVSYQRSYNSLRSRTKKLQEKLNGNGVSEKGFAKLCKRCSVILASSLGLTGLGLITVRCFSVPVAVESNWGWAVLMHCIILKKTIRRVSTKFFTMGWEQDLKGVFYKDPCNGATINNVGVQNGVFKWASVEIFP